MRDDGINDEGNVTGLALEYLELSVSIDPISMGF